MRWLLVIKAALTLAAVLVLPLGTATAGVYTTLHSFCAKGKCKDGTSPYAPLLAGPDGTLYGTTPPAYSQHLKVWNHGTVFSLSQVQGEWKLNTLYTFCTAGGQCPDGSSPSGGLIMDTAGNLYGVAAGGGDNGEGVVFELSPSGGSWTERVLYSFCALANCADGGGPAGRLAYAGSGNGAFYDGVSPLYGIAGGGVNGQGVAYVLTQAGGNFSEQTLYAFCAQQNCADGGAPSWNLLLDSAGNLFGLTTSGGANNAGTAFELTGSNYRVLYSFCAQAGCSDGATPSYDDGLVMDATGTLTGTTINGGATGKECSAGCGVIFQLAPNNDQYAFAVRYTFCVRLRQHRCMDGRFPTGVLLRSSSGDLYGSTILGALHEEGGIFRLRGSNEEVLYRFCDGGCGEGYQPQTGLIWAAKGILAGTAFRGGGFNEGSAFEFEP